MFSENNILTEFIKKNYIFDTTQYHDNNYKSDHTPNENLPKIPNVLNHTIINNTVTYKYLDDNILAREFSNDYDYSKDILLKFCLFNINTELEQPFLEYLLKETDNILDFPETILLKEIFVDINKQLEVSNSWLFGNNTIDIDKINETIEEIFLEQTITIFKYLTNATHEKGIKCYRGFIKENKNIYVFFDCSGIEIQKQKYIKCTVPEILNQDKTNIKIENNIIKLFENNKWLVNIKDINNEFIQHPNIIYLCDEENNEYINMLNNEEEISILYPKIDHDIFGYIYIFSEVPLKKDEKIKRFVSFYNNELPTIDKLDANYNTHYFIHNDQKYLAITEEEQFVEL